MPGQGQQLHSGAVIQTRFPTLLETWWPGSCAVSLVPTAAAAAWQQPRGNGVPTRAVPVGGYLLAPWVPGSNSVANGLFRGRLARGGCTQAGSTPRMPGSPVSPLPETRGCKDSKQTPSPRDAGAPGPAWPLSPGLRLTLARGQDMESGRQGLLQQRGHRTQGGRLQKTCTTWG